LKTGASRKKNNLKKKEAKSENSAVTEELEKELLYTKQQLHNTIEQMETSLEELKSTNEELQSTNEELQSTNEESLTTKEEMQSLNEELMTINMQYQAKAEELTQLNNDMKNLLDNTEIGTIFLDTNMTILRFTPQVKKLFNVIPTDIGRSINDIVFNFDYNGLEEDIHRVIETLAIKEAEIKTKSDEWYTLRIMPYRTMDNFINGAVLTFNKITSLKHLEYQLEALKQYAMSIIETLRDPALLLDKDLQILNANTNFIRFFKAEGVELKGMSFAVVVHELWKTSKLDQLLKKCVHQDTQLTFTHDFPEIGTKTLFITAKPSINKETKETSIVMVIIVENG
jgi:two-component system CheB/CheR fusion protein